MIREILSPQGEKIGWFDVRWRGGDRPIIIELSSNRDRTIVPISRRDALEIINYMIWAVDINLPEGE